MTRKCSLGLVLGGLVMGLSAVNAATIGVTLDGTGGSGTGGLNASFAATPRATVAWLFTPTKNITVDSLAYYDELGDGLARAHDVGIFRESDLALLTSLTVPAGTAATFVQNPATFTLDPNGGFRFAALATPLQLTAGVRYALSATTGTFVNDTPPGADVATDRYIINAPTATTFAADFDVDKTDFTATGEFKHYVFNAGPTYPLTYPATVSGSDRGISFIAANLTYVPEPATLSLLGSGLYLLARRRNRA